MPSNWPWVFSRWRTGSTATSRIGQMHKQIRACISGLEKSFYRYAAGGRGTNRRRNSPRKSRRVTKRIATSAITSHMTCLTTSLQWPKSFTRSRRSQHKEWNPLRRQVNGRRGPRDQPEEEVEAPTTDVDIPSDADIGIMANTFLNALSTLDNGDTHAQEEERDRSLFPCGSPHHRYGEKA